MEAWITTPELEKREYIPLDQLIYKAIAMNFAFVKLFFLFNMQFLDRMNPHLTIT